MKGEYTWKILEAIEEGIATSADLIAAFVGAGYGASRGKLDREFEKRHNRRQSLVRKIKNAFEDAERFYNLISKLNADELIAKKNKERKGKWSLTQKGKQKLRVFRRRAAQRQFLPSVGGYTSEIQKQKEDKLKIVIFDIPEQERYKRDWLRAVLRALDFQMLQKSVWAGKNQIPEKLMEDFRKEKLIPYIEIFEVSKSGSLKQIV